MLFISFDKWTAQDEKKLDNATHWDSVFDMLKRFLELKDILQLVVPNDELKFYDWNKLQIICNILQPLKVF